MAVAQFEVAAPTTTRTGSQARAHVKERGSGVLTRGLYFLFGAAVLLETFYSAQSYPDDIGQYLPFFQDFATWTHVKGLSFSIAELLMLALLLILLFKSLSDRAFRFDKGSLMRPLGFYMLMVLLGEVHGLASGGNYTTSLWELRSQVYMFIAYVIACNAITTRRQVNVLVWILLVGAGLKAIQGVYRYQVELHGNIHSVESLLTHEQSFFFNVFLTVAPALFFYGGSRRMKAFVLFLLPFVLIADLANQRRAAVLAIIVGLAGLLVITAILHPARRRAVIITAIIAAIVWPPYYAAFKNNTGLAGEIAHAVASNNHPDQRDLNSNLYRINEDADILATVKSSSITQIIGYGYGKPMLVPYALPDISEIYGFWNIMPHNSILWVWMRTGTIGFLLLWFLVGTAIVQALRVARRLNDLYLKGIAVCIALIVAQQVLFGDLDLQWTNYRNMITLGVLFALISRLALLVKEDKTAPERVTSHHAWERQPGVSRTLAVVDGRLTRTSAPTRRAGRARRFSRTLHR